MRSVHFITVNPLYAEEDTVFHHDLHWLAARLAGGCAGVSYLLYLREVFRGHVKPQRATWFIWSCVSILLLAGLIASGEREMIWVPWAYALGSSLIFIASIWRGVGGWSKLDLACIGCAACSLVVWKILGTPQVPIFINLFADLMGFIPTFKKAWHDPRSERNPGWIFFTLGNLFNFGSVTTWNLPGTVYMIYMFCGCLLVSILVYRRLPRSVRT